VHAIAQHRLIEQLVREGEAHSSAHLGQAAYRDGLMAPPYAQQSHDVALAEVRGGKWHSAETTPDLYSRASAQATASLLALVVFITLPS
jgi:hypothetical protein